MGLQSARQVFLIGMAGVYLAALGSLFLQLPSLYGARGLLPAQGQLRNIREDQGIDDTAKLLSVLPTLLWFHKDLEISVDMGMDLIALSGIILSGLAMLSWRFRNKIVFALLWVCYFSLYQVGQTFLHFQWDILLLEAGCLAVIAAPLLAVSRRSSDSEKRYLWTDDDPSIPMFGVRWLIFRLMYLSGIVKLQSNCPTWWGLTAMDVHYESQCIPGPLAWHAHHLPHWFQALSVVLVFAIEGFLPFLFFAPVRPLQIISAVAQTFLMLLIMVTGNYNFFNILTILLCVSLVDDSFLSIVLPKSFSHFHTTNVTSRPRFSWFQLAITMCSLLAVSAATAKLFGLELVLDGVHTRIESKIMFSKKDFSTFVTYSMTAGIILGACDFVLTSLFAVIHSLKRRRFANLLNILPQVAVIGFLFSASLVTLSWNDKGFQLREHKAYWRYAEEANDFLNPYQVVNSYGLFRRMTGVGGRPEVVVEGSYTGKDGLWEEYNFKYKPTDLNRMPPLCIPHQPRLDWQMWFAALGRIEGEVWLQHFAVMLLEGRKEAYDLIDPVQPFPREQPAKFVRMILYHYFYTKPGLNSTAWWTREAKHIYLQPISLAPLEDQIQNLRDRLGFDSSQRDLEGECLASTLCTIVQTSRRIFDWASDYKIVCCLCFVVYTLSTVWTLRRRKHAKSVAPAKVKQT